MTLDLKLRGLKVQRSSCDVIDHTVSSLFRTFSVRSRIHHSRHQVESSRLSFNAVDHIIIMASIEEQQERLDDTDLYALAWADALTKCVRNWGGRGQGGRGLARRTYQRYDCSVPNVTLEYLGHPSLLENAHLKLLADHIYGLVGQAGKSSLMRRIHARKIPGFPPHLSSLYLHRDMLKDTQATAASWLQDQQRSFTAGSKQDADIASLEKLQEALDEAIEAEDEEEITSLTDQMALIEEEVEQITIQLMIDEQLKAANILATDFMCQLTPGKQQRLLLSLMTICPCDVLLLDNPTANLDIPGLLHLRALMAQVDGTVLIASGDVDFLNDVATDIILLEDKRLHYFTGNYRSFVKQQEQLDRGKDRQASAIEKKQIAMRQTLDNIRKQPVPKRGGTKKKNKQVTSHKKRMERLQIDGDVNHNAKRYDHDKANQFRFRICRSKWNEPLIFASDVEFCVSCHDRNDVIFDSVDFCVKEGATHLLVGESTSGKSAFLHILGKLLQPTGGDVLHAPALNVVVVDNMVTLEHRTTSGNKTAVSFMWHFHPSCSVQAIREQLANFGLGPLQIETPLSSLSDGEMYRLSLAQATMQEVHVLILDDPSGFLDVGSMESLSFGLNEWNGTLVLASHDANFARSFPDAETFALLPMEQKLRRVVGGIDEYLRSYSDN